MNITSQLADTIKYLADGLVHLTPVDADEKHFHLPAEIHVIQGICFSVLCIFTLWVSKFGTITAPPKRAAPPLSITEQLLRAVLTINLLLQLVYKSLRGWKIGLHYMFFTTLAIAVPDTSQLHLPFEVANFWVQHYVLLVLPIWILGIRRFELNPSWGLTVYAIGLGMALHFFAQLPAALLTGVNVNYMLWPPPNVPYIYSTHMWRVNFTMTFVPLAWMTGYLLPKMVLRMQREELEKAKRHHHKHK